MRDGLSPASKTGQKPDNSMRRGGRRKGEPNLTLVQQGIVLGMKAMKVSHREVASRMGINKDTVTRVLSTHEAEFQRATARSIFFQNLPEMACKLVKINLSGDRQGLVDTMRGLRVFQNRAESEHIGGGGMERTYDMTMFLFKREKGRLPKSEEELLEFDKTIELEPLVKASAELQD